jgi:flagellar basal body rod protein FlgC
MLATNIAASGLMNAIQRLDGAAVRIAQFGQPQTGDNDLAAQMVALVEAKNDFKANVAVMRTADEMTGALLNMIT